MKKILDNEITKDPSGFVAVTDFVPSAIQEIRYFSTYNFIGDRIDGYEQPVALITKEAARALESAANGFMVLGYRIKIFDTYRPASAVTGLWHGAGWHFVLWGLEDQDVRMKPYFYPDLNKQDLFELGYIATRSGHSRGSTVDLTLLDMKTGRELDMGSPFDLFSELSHPDNRDITDRQYRNRMLLQSVMMRSGFEPIDCEWWHFTLRDEPYPDTFFDFPVSLEYLRR